MVEDDDDAKSQRSSASAKSHSGPIVPPGRPSPFGALLQHLMGSPPRTRDGEAASSPKDGITRPSAIKPPSVPASPGLGPPKSPPRPAVLRGGGAFMGIVQQLMTPPDADERRVSGRSSLDDGTASVGTVVRFSSSRLSEAEPHTTPASSGMPSTRSSFSSHQPEALPPDTPDMRASAGPDLNHRGGPLANGEGPGEPALRSPSSQSSASGPLSPRGRPLLTGKSGGALPGLVEQLVLGRALSPPTSPRQSVSSVQASIGQLSDAGRSGSFSARSSITSLPVDLETSAPLTVASAGQDLNHSGGPLANGDPGEPALRSPSSQSSASGPLSPRGRPLLTGKSGGALPGLVEQLVLGRALSPPTSPRQSISSQQGSAGRCDSEPPDGILGRLGQPVEADLQNQPAPVPIAPRPSTPPLVAHRLGSSPRRAASPPPRPATPPLPPPTPSSPNRTASPLSRGPGKPSSPTRRSGSPRRAASPKGRVPPPLAPPSPRRSGSPRRASPPRWSASREKEPSPPPPPTPPKAPTPPPLQPLPSLEIPQSAAADDPATQPTPRQGDPPGKPAPPASPKQHARPFRMPLEAALLSLLGLSSPTTSPKAAAATPSTPSKGDPLEPSPAAADVATSSPAAVPEAPSVHAKITQRLSTAQTLASFAVATQDARHVRLGNGRPTQWPPQPPPGRTASATAAPPVPHQPQKSEPPRRARAVVASRRPEEVILACPSPNHWGGSRVHVPDGTSPGALPRSTVAAAAAAHSPATAYMHPVPGFAESLDAPAEPPVTSTPTRGRGRKAGKRAAKAVAQRSASSGVTRRVAVAPPSIKSTTRRLKGQQRPSGPRPRPSSAPPVPRLVVTGTLPRTPMTKPTSRTKSPPRHSSPHLSSVSAARSSSPPFDPVPRHLSPSLGRSHSPAAVLGLDASGGKRLSRPCAAGYGREEELREPSLPSRNHSPGLQRSVQPKQFVPAGVAMARSGSPTATNRGPTSRSFHCMSDGFLPTAQAGGSTWTTTPRS